MGLESYTNAKTVWDEVENAEQRCVPECPRMLVTLWCNRAYLHPPNPTHKGSARSGAQLPNGALRYVEDPAEMARVQTEVGSE